jgi:hypothetical protein
VPWTEVIRLRDRLSHHYHPHRSRPAVGHRRDRCAPDGASDSELAQPTARLASSLTSPLSRPPHPRALDPAPFRRRDQTATTPNVSTEGRPSSYRNAQITASRSHAARAWRVIRRQRGCWAGPLGPLVSATVRVARARSCRRAACSGSRARCVPTLGGGGRARGGSRRAGASCCAIVA